MILMNQIRCRNVVFIPSLYPLQKMFYTQQTDFSLETLSSFRLHALLNELTLLKARIYYMWHDVSFHVFSFTVMPVANEYLLMYFSLFKINITFSVKCFSSNCAS